MQYIWRATDEMGVVLAALGGEQLSIGGRNALEQCTSINNFIWEAADDYTKAVSGLIKKDNASSHDLEQLSVLNDAALDRSSGWSGPDSGAPPVG